MSYGKYASPNTLAMYSSQFFNELTFERASWLAKDYPVIASPGAMIHWVFHDAVPASAMATVVVPGEVIPHIKDLLPICKQMEDAFNAGQRSVVATFLESGQYIEKNIHFSKVSTSLCSTVLLCNKLTDMQIRLFMLINNNKKMVEYASGVFDQLTFNKLASDVVEKFKRACIMSPVSGFFVTAFPLWQLGCLLNENWLEEDVLNSMAELLYFRTAATTSQGNDPSFIFLPTTFFNDARRLYQESPRQYSSNIRDLRSRLRASSFTSAGFLICENDHFSGYYYRCHVPPLLEHGDSMGGAITPEALPIFQWTLSGLDCVPPSSVVSTRVPRQKMAVGSCGVAAHNFVESHINPGVPQWTDKSSDSFRQVALRDLILFHSIAVDHDGVGCISFELYIY